MIRRFLCIVVILLNCLNHSIAQTHNTLAATALKPVGRFWIDSNKNLELISSAVHFGFSFSGKQCTLYVSINDVNGHNYLQYELDGVYQKRIKIEGGNTQSINITASNNSKHTVEIYKCTEATTGAIIIKKIEGSNLHSIQPNNAPLIEFIGKQYYMRRRC